MNYVNLDSNNGEGWNSSMGGNQGQSINSKSGIVGATLTMIKSLIGTGIVALPYAVQFCGWRCGLVILLVLFTLSNFCIRNLFKVVNDITQDSIYYQDLGEIVFGEKISKLISFFIFFFTFGCCVGYVIFIRQFFSEVLVHLGVVDTSLWTLLITFLLIVPFVFVNEYSSLKNSSLIGVCLFGFSCLYMISLDINILNNKENNINYDDYKNEFDIHGIFLYLGISVYAFEGAGTLFHLRESMQDPKSIDKCFLISSIVAIIFYIIFQTLTLQAFGSNIQQIALLNFQYTGWASYVAKIGFSMQVLFSVPVNIFICFSMIEKKMNLQDRTEQKEIKLMENELELFKSVKILIYLIRFLLLSVIFVIAYIFPEFCNMLRLIGGFGGIIIQFVFPSIIYLKHFRNDISLTDKICNISVVVIGISASIIVTYETIISIFG